MQGRLGAQVRQESTQEPRTHGLHGLRRSLAVSTVHYCSKPALAFYHAIELEAYAKAGLRLDHPILDLGCATGTFAAMLRDRGVVDRVEVGLEYCWPDVRQAGDGGFAGSVQGDGRALPFDSGAFRSVIANAVLCSVRSEVDVAIAEVRRVLVKAGVFVLTLPVPEGDRAHLLPRLLRKAGRHALAERALARTHRRLNVYQNLDEATWVRKLAAAGFRIEQVQRYYTLHEGIWSNILNTQPFRAFGLLQLSRLAPLRPLVARLQERLFRRVLEREARQGEHDHVAGCVLIVATKEG